MYLMYADESGDTGLDNSPTRYFILSALVLHELPWRRFLDDIIEFRRQLRRTKGLKLRDEIHASRFITGGAKLSLNIPRHERVEILKECIRWCSRQPDSSIINIVVDKAKRPTIDVFELAWTALVQRFENTIRHHNFPGPANPDDRGLLIPDHTDDRKLQILVRKMRRYNPVPNIRTVFGGGSRNLTLNYVVEDPFFKSSDESFFHQMVDVVSYVVRQLYEPNKYFSKKAGKKVFYQLDPVLCKHASANHPYGIVEL